MSADSQPVSRGRVIFFLLLIIIGCIAIFYPYGTSPMGIEERFSSALGITSGQDAPGGEGGTGFSLEGHPLLYLLVLALLGGVCWVAYRKFGV